MNLARSNAVEYNPIDLVESLFAKQSLDFERRNFNEIAVEIQGKWNNMLLFFSFEASMRCLHLSCLMDIPIAPDVRDQTADRGKIFELLALANEDLWLGHFSYWTEQAMPVFKHSVIVSDTEEIFQSKLTQMMDIAIKECERMYPVFNVVLAKGMEPRQAMYPMLMETIGRA